MTQRVRLTKRPSSAPQTAATSSGGDYSFARLWRCALQVNPFKYQGTYRGQNHAHDEDGYSQALLEKCLGLGIRVVELADHGSVESVDKPREVLATKEIVVCPGLEIASTKKIHMVCLFPEDTTQGQINRYLEARSNRCRGRHSTRPRALSSR